MSHSDHHLSFKARNSKQMSLCIRLHNSECSRVFGHGKLKWGFTVDAVGTRILHLCSNHNGHVPTIIQSPGLYLTHSYVYIYMYTVHAQTLKHTHSKNTQVIISIFIFFAFIFLSPSYVFIKTMPSSQSRLNKWFLEIPFEGPCSKRGGRL